MRDDQIKTLLQNSKTIAMIGVSSEKKGEDRKKFEIERIKTDVLLAETISKKN